MLLRAAIIVLALIVPAAGVRAQEPEITVNAEIERTTVSVGEPFQYQITINGTLDAPVLQLPAIPDAQVSGGEAYQQHKSSFSIDHGKRTQSNRVSVTYNWVITATKPGELVIPVFEVPVAGKKFATNEVRIRVNPVEKSDAILIRASIDADKAYVGQLIKLRVTFFNSRITVGAPVIEMPGIAGVFDVYNIDTPVLPGQAAVDFLGSQTLMREIRTTVNGVGYSAFTFERTIVPRKPGTITIGPASVVAAVADRSSRSPWDAPKYRRVTAASEPITITVSELPRDGAPSDFSGLVGAYEIEAAATPTEVSVGDPITFNVTISGPEPLELVPDPVTEKAAGLAGAFKIIADSSEPRRNGSRLVFTRTIRTVTDKVTEIPSIAINFFDPVKGEYRTERTSPIPLKVRPTRSITAADAIGDTAPIASGESIDSRTGGLAANRVASTALIDRSFDLATLIKSPLVIVATASPPALYALAFLVAARRKHAGDTPARRRKRALPVALATLQRTDLDPAARASAALRGYLADTRGAPNGETLTPDETHQLLAPHDTELAVRVRELLARCDAARFAASANDSSLLVDEARALLQQLTTGGRA